MQSSEGFRLNTTHRKAANPKQLQAAAATSFTSV
jgi:hypothetical protein